MGQREKRSKAVAAARVLLKAAVFLLHVGPAPAFQFQLSAEKFLPHVPKYFALMPVRQCLAPASPHTHTTGRIWEASSADFLQLIT